MTMLNCSLHRENCKKLESSGLSPILDIAYCFQALLNFLLGKNLILKDEIRKVVF